MDFLDIKKITEVIGANLAQYFAVIVVVGVVVIGLAGWSLFNYKAMTDLSEKRIAFETYKAAEADKVRSKDLTLEKEKIHIEARSKQLEQAELAVSKRAAETESRLAQVTEKERRTVQMSSSLTPRMAQLRKEQEIQRLMGEFSSLGVNTRAAPPCDDPSALTRYNRGLAILTQIETLDDSHDRQGGKYDYFIRRNSNLSRNVLGLGRDIGCPKAAAK